MDDAFWQQYEGQAKAYAVAHGTTLDLRAGAPAGTTRAISTWDQFTSWVQVNSLVRDTSAPPASSPATGSSVATPAAAVAGAGVGAVVGGAVGGPFGLVVGGLLGLLLGAAAASRGGS